MIRLLQFQDGEFSLTKFADHEIPEYAILSHTWGLDSEEVDFQDITKHRGQTKSGYDKLHFCAEQAARNGLRYFWIDTCSIDKSNGPEIDEAIRLMFRWYAAAVRCYVYLSDVPGVQESLSTVETAFAKSRWFTRGWTLQELIAPKSVEFFSRNKEFLGSRASRMQEIHKITKIPIGALQGTPISNFSPADRISWAAGRVTTREEDSAYCLLGLFNIHIPVMYGEGKQHAMDRLQRAIQIASSPVLALPKNALWIVPFARNPRFTGREVELARLQEKLFTKDSTSRIAVAGLGGMGKTQLVLEMLYRTKEMRPDCSILWIPATSVEALYQGYLNVARQLGIQGLEEESTDVKQRVQDHLSKDEAGQWLLVFDNIDDMDIWMAKPGGAQESHGPIDYLPSSKQGCIIFTTRDGKVAVKLAYENVIELSELDKVAATALLKNLLARPGLVKDWQNATALLTELTYLPLAMVQAAAYISENRITIGEYLSLLADKEEEVIDVLSEDFETDGRYREVKNPVATTWLISFEQILRRDTLAAEYLSFMACIDPKDIPQSLLPPGTSRNKQTVALGTL
jgi:hypothetical protein